MWWWWLKTPTHYNSVWSFHKTESRNVWTRKTDKRWFQAYNLEGYIHIPWQGGTTGGEKFLTGRNKSNWLRNRNLQPLIIIIHSTTLITYFCTCGFVLENVSLLNWNFCLFCKQFYKIFKFLFFFLVQRTLHLRFKKHNIITNFNIWYF